LFLGVFGVLVFFLGDGERRRVFGATLLREIGLDHLDFLGHVHTGDIDTLGSQPGEHVEFLGPEKALVGHEGREDFALDLQALPVVVLFLVFLQRVLVLFLVFGRRGFCRQQILVGGGELLVHEEAFGARPQKRYQEDQHKEGFTGVGGRQRRGAARGGRLRGRLGRFLRGAAGLFGLEFRWEQVCFDHGDQSTTFLRARPMPTPRLLRYVSSCLESTFE
jgi:hypothetical protein